MIELNKAQKEVLVNNMFEDEDRDWLEYSFSELKDQKIEIRPASDGWWEMFINGKILTELNFNAYEDVLAKIKKLG